MYSITRKITRPSVELEFRNMLHDSISAETRSHWVETYKLPGKCLYVDVNISVDGLEMTTTMIWDSKESWDEYQSDPILLSGLFSPIHTYQDENGFIRETVSEEEI